MWRTGRAVCSWAETILFNPSPQTLWSVQFPHNGLSGPHSLNIKSDMSPFQNFSTAFTEGESFRIKTGIIKAVIRNSQIPSDTVSSVLYYYRCYSYHDAASSGENGSCVWSTETVWNAAKHFYFLYLINKVTTSFIHHRIKI